MQPLQPQSEMNPVRIYFSKWPRVKMWGNWEGKWKVGRPEGKLAMQRLSNATLNHITKQWVKWPNEYLPRAKGRSSQWWKCQFQNTRVWATVFRVWSIILCRNRIFCWEHTTAVPCQILVQIWKDTHQMVPVQTVHWLAKLSYISISCNNSRIPCRTQYSTVGTQLRRTGTSEAECKALALSCCSSVVNLAMQLQKRTRNHRVLPSLWPFREHQQ